MLGGESLSKTIRGSDMLNVMVVDDEALARKSLQLSLLELEDLSPPVEAKNAREALSLVDNCTPDLVFMDIDMPGMSGIELAEKLGKSCEVIFITAYNEFAVEAFQLNAIDYLLKPINPQRLKDAIGKAKKRIASRNFTDYSNVSSLIESLKVNQRNPGVKKVVVKHAGRILLIDIDNISHVTGAGNYVEIFLLSGEKLIHKVSMSAMENQLGADKFTRIHRSIIINNQCIVEVRKTESSDYLLYMRTGHKLSLSRRKREVLAQIIG